MADGIDLFSESARKAMAGLRKVGRAPKLPGGRTIKKDRSQILALRKSFQSTAKPQKSKFF